MTEPTPSELPGQLAKLRQEEARLNARLADETDADLRAMFESKIAACQNQIAQLTSGEANPAASKKVARKRGSKTIKAKLDGDGAIAQDNSFAVGAGAVGINGKNLGEVLVNSIKIVYGAGTYAPEDKRRMVAAYLNWLMLDWFIRPGSETTLLPFHC